jgi:hypothetical protein
MGVLTQTMTKLRNEIMSGRRARQTSQEEREQQTADRRSQVSTLCTAFARDRAGAQRAWLGRTTVDTRGKQGRRRPAEPVSATAKAMPKRHAAPKPAMKTRVRHVANTSKLKTKSPKH